MDHKQILDDGLRRQHAALTLAQEAIAAVAYSDEDNRSFWIDHA
ncbi:hypothetical protein [Micrococcus lylae]|nr:hypothetical protein [Micrococcus lylae]WIK81752.1 hypothetical protein CJ228_009090 [Micrococcus lylae]